MLFQKIAAFIFVFTLYLCFIFAAFFAGYNISAIALQQPLIPKHVLVLIIIICSVVDILLILSGSYLTYKLDKSKKEP